MNILDLPRDLTTSSSTFAIGKIIRAFLRAREDLGSDVKISSGSWQLDFIEAANIFYPEEVPLLPLDWEVIFGDQKEIQRIARVAARRSARSHRLGASRRSPVYRQTLFALAEFCR